MEPELQAALVKAAVFVLVQALVYLILSRSSAVFSRTKSLGHGLRPSRSLSARRMLALLSDLPLAGEPSPRPSPTSPGIALRSPTGVRTEGDR